jgi:hypothetical protein
MQRPEYYQAQLYSMAAGIVLFSETLSEWNLARRGLAAPAGLLNELIAQAKTVLAENANSDHTDTEQLARGESDGDHQEDAGA